MHHHSPEPDHPAATEAGARTAATAPGALSLRALQPGDIGWVISRHGAIYAQEYGWSMAFEALVARIAADFVDRFDASREACWIAEARLPAALPTVLPANAAAPASGTVVASAAIAGAALADTSPQRLGCVFLVQARDDTSGLPEPGVAQLRLLIVEPLARGTGLGTQLVAHCTAFARRAGYSTLRLWTQSNLLAARQLYQREGYRLLGTEPHHSFGRDLVGEIWEMPLRPHATSPGPSVVPRPAPRSGH